MTTSTHLRHVLFPGRHHVLTTFQEHYLRALLAGTECDAAGKPLEFADGANIAFVVTSADHGNTRRNPVAGHRREAQVERFSATTGIPCSTWPIDDVPQTDRFARYLLDEVAADGGPRMTPAETVVATSTPAVAELFTALGFRIAPVELCADGTHRARLPWLVLEAIVEAGTLDAGDDELHPASHDVWSRYGLLAHAHRVFADPLLGNEGDITGTRDYRTYAASFDSGAARKWLQLREHVAAGRIVDVGCGAGSLLAEAAGDAAMAECDLYGIEAARPLYEECQHRRRAGVFANPNTFFFQRNFMTEAVFEPRSVDTTLTTALTHEIWSYLGADALEEFVRRVFEHTRPGGVWLNLDVCGPVDGGTQVTIVPRDDDQHVLERDEHDFPRASKLDPDDAPSATALIEQLSPLERFVQFAHDWHFDADHELRRDEDGRIVVDTSMRVASEWLTKKDYPDNWLSEMHESFSHFDPEDWRALLGRAGFETAAGTNAWTNSWLVSNRFEPDARLVRGDDPTAPAAWPTTHILLVARRPHNA